MGNNMTDIKYVKKLLEMFEKSSLSSFELSDGDFRLRLEKNGRPVTLPVPHIPDGPAAEDRAQAQTLDFNNLKEVKSPMVGVFYSASAPGEKPFVERGSKVKKGDVLCIVEAMKLLNEVTSDFDGEIADICVADGQIVEYSQVLFKIF